MTFSTDLALAQSIDSYLIDKHKTLFGPATSLTHDLVYLPTGELVELKVERRGVESPNLFVETVANNNKQSPGGPYRARQDGVALYIFIHASCKTMFAFRTDTVISVLEAAVKQENLKQHKIYNKTYYTLGFAVPKRLLLPHCIDIISLGEGS